ncbi:hypothetical protein [Arcticibacterium luteifluviistationis]|uniref:hypothetical protein n=1 Tax=Arcticibacterium luteifluviistationis TaxID=1784714 RepID=UPI0013A6E35F|nr:hypothetical protein [Arcticibacterium luteifluviistationis]
MESNINVGIVLAVIGCICAVLGFIIFTENEVIKYSILGIGAIIALFGFLLSKSKKR